MYPIIAMAILGGIGGAILGVIKKKSVKNGKLPMILFALVIGVSSALINSPGIKTTVMKNIDPNYEVRLRVQRKMSSLVEEPMIKAKLAEFNDPGKAAEFSRNLTRGGLKRLSFAELKIWNELRLEMAKASPALCSGFWSGRLSEDKMYSAFTIMGNEKTDKWIEISLKASKLEMENADFVRVSQQDFQNSLSKIGELNSEDDRLKMSTILVKGLNASDEEGCWMMEKMLDGARRLDDVSAEKFLRYLAGV